jgi:hypothetical protein
MKHGLMFGLGVFVCTLVFREIRQIVHDGQLQPIWAGFAAFLIYSALGCIGYWTGSALFKRNVSSLMAFIFGIVAMLIETAFSLNFFARTTLDLNQEALRNASFEDLFGALAQLLLPLIICAVLTPVLGYRKDLTIGARSRRNGSIAKGR